MSLEPWTDLTSTPLPQGLEFCRSVVSADGYVYVMGGRFGSFGTGYTLVNTVYSAKINAGGTLGAWTNLTLTPLPQAIYAFSSVISADGYIYVMGGLTSSGLLNTVYSAKIIAGGTLSAWTNLTLTPLPQAIYAFSSVISADGYIYVMGGGSSSGFLNTVYSAQIIAGGTLSAWTNLTLTPLPVNLYRDTAVVSADGYIYVMGGDSNSNLVNTVYSAQIIAGGTLSAWTNLTLTPLPQSCTDLEAVVSTDGYIYVMGGLKSIVLNTVYSAKINAGGTLNSWTDLTSTPLPQALSGLTAIVSADGYIYVMGGRNNGTTVVATVYSAKIFNPTPTPTPTSNICFPAGTPIKTDQGIFQIETLDKEKHTINNQPILHITKTITLDSYLICFERNSIGRNIPNKKTIMSKDHKINFQNQMVPAYRFLDFSQDVKKVKYSGEVLYNVLLSKHSLMNVNGLVCETLHPENIIAKLYSDNITEGKRNDIIILMNDALKQRDLVKYKSALDSI